MKHKIVKLRQFASLGLILVIVNNFSICAAQTRLFTLEQELDRRWPTNNTPSCAFSPDGQWVAIVTTQLDSIVSGETRIQAGIPEGLEGSRIDLINTISNERIELSGGGANYGLAWSPTGDRLAFLSTRDGQLAVWVWERSSKMPRKVPGGAFRATTPWDLPVWSRDGKRVLVLLPGENRIRPETSKKSEEGKPIVREFSPRGVANTETVTERKPVVTPQPDVLVLLNVNTGEVTQITLARTRIGWRQVAPNGKWVGYLGYSGQGTGIVGSLWDLHVFDLVHNEDKIIARGVPSFGSGAAWSAYSTAIAYTTFAWEHHSDPSNPQNLSPLKPSSELWVVYLDGTNPQKLKQQLQDKSDGTGRMFMAAPVWMPDDKALLVLSNGRICALSADRVQEERCFAVPGRKIIDLLGSNRGSDFVLLPHQPDTVIVAEMNEDNENAGYAKLNLKTGATHILREEASPAPRLGKGMFHSDISRDGGRVVYVRERADLPPDFWLADTNFDKERKVRELNAELADVKFGRSQVIDFLSSDGDKLRAALLLPPGYQPGVRVPLIVTVYPHQEHEANQFGLEGVGPMNMQLLASRGYAVLKPDSLMQAGWPIESLARCVLPAILRVIDLGIADPDAIGIAGHSQGGMATVALLTRSTLFRAAVASSGYYDLFSFYGAGGAGVLEITNSILTTPWKNQRVYLENTPILNLDRVRTPLLLVAGLKDPFSEASQPEEVFNDLQRLGQEVTLVEYPGEGHVPFMWSRANQIDYATRMISWFDDHLKKPTNSPAATGKPN